MASVKTRTTAGRGARPDRPRVTVRIDLRDSKRLGPGKIALLEAIAREHSISAAARSLGMSYRRAWLLVAGLNRMFREAAVRTRANRGRASGAEVTAFGKRLIVAYRTIERGAARVARPSIRALEKALPSAATKRHR